MDTCGVLNSRSPLLGSGTNAILFDPWIFSAMAMAMSIFRTLCVLVVLFSPLLLFLLFLPLTSLLSASFLVLLFLFFLFLPSAFSLDALSIFSLFLWSQCRTSFLFEAVMWSICQMLSNMNPLYGNSCHVELVSIRPMLTLLYFLLSILTTCRLIALLRYRLNYVDMLRHCDWTLNCVEKLFLSLRENQMHLCVA